MSKQSENVRSAASNENKKTAKFVEILDNKQRPLDLHRLPKYEAKKQLPAVVTKLHFCV